MLASARSENNQTAEPRKTRQAHQGIAVGAAGLYYIITTRGKWRGVEGRCQKKVGERIGVH